jgi:proline iminopeptidase
LPGYFYDRKNSLSISRALSEPGFKSDTMARLIGENIGKKDLTEGMRRFKKPVLLVMGRQDPIGETTQYQIRDACRQSKLVFIEKSGHFPWLEQPSDFYSALNRFLKLIQ